MRVAMLSDAHLTGPEDPNQARLLDLLAELRVDRLCLLGDIFQAWWHFGRAPFPAYAPVVEALARHRLSFVGGNHDFHAARFFSEFLSADVGDRLTPNWDGVALHLSHGDEADTSLAYRVSTGVLRSRSFAALVDAMGPVRAWPFLRRLAGTPGGSPNPLLLAAQEAQGRAWLAARPPGVPGLHVVGHTHAPSIREVPGGTLVNLGDWVRWHTWLLVEDGRPTLLQRIDGRNRAFPAAG